MAENPYVLTLLQEGDSVIAVARDFEVLKRQFLVQERQ